MLRKVLVLGIIVLFVGAGVVPSTGMVEIARKSIMGRDILYVGGDGPGNYSKIQEPTDDPVEILWSKIVGDQLMDVKIGDINGDGFNDVVVGPSENKIEAIDSSGNLLWTYPTNYWVWHVAIGDLNGDSYNDVVGYDAQSPHYLYAIDSSGDLLWQYQLPITGSGNEGAEHIAIGDINDDGKNEVIVGADCSEAIYVFNQTGEVLWTYSTFHISNVKIGDIDGDKVKDIIVSSRTSYAGRGLLIVIDGSGSQMWSYSFSKRIGESVYGDLNGDGKNDIVVIDWDWKGYNVYAINNSGDDLIWSYSLPTNPNTIAMGDIGNGDINIIIGCAYDHVYVLDSSGEPIWNYSVGGGVSKVAIGDLDNDGINDIAVSSYGNAVYALNGSGGLIWKFIGTSYFRDLAIGDINNDGVEDVVTISDDQKAYALTTGGNQPPNAPKITGSTNGKVGVEYPYEFLLSDPEGDSMYLRVDWGNGTPGPWQGLYDSGTTVKLNHTWNKQGNFTSRAQVKDIYGNESAWGYLEVTMPKNKPSIQNTKPLQIFEHFMNSFPLLEQGLYTINRCFA